MAPRVSTNYTIFHYYKAKQHDETMKEQLQFSYSDIQDTLTETPHSPCKNLLVTEVSINLYQEVKLHHAMSLLLAN